MSLKHVILVVLKKGAASGYDINKTFDGPLGIFWSTSHQRVYRALAALSKDGWVEFDHHSQVGKPDKKVYRITGKGDAELQAWLLDCQQAAPVNEGLLVKFFAGELCPTEALLRQIDVLEQGHRQRLQHYQLQERELSPVVDQQGIDVRRGYLTLRKGILMEQARLAWCQEARQMLEEDLARVQGEQR